MGDPYSSFHSCLNITSGSSSITAHSHPSEYLKIASAVPVYLLIVGLPEIFVYHFLAWVPFLTEIKSNFFVVHHSSIGNQIYFPHWISIVAYMRKKMDVNRQEVSEIPDDQEQFPFHAG